MKTSRRGFIRLALAAGAFPFVPACTTRRVFGEGDKVRLACVGISNQGWYDIKEFAKTGLCEFSAFCDTDMGSKRTAECLKAYPDVPRFQDFRRMLDAMDGRIDAVAVMIPDFSHFPVTMEAMRRGLAVYVEKPLAHTFEECELLMAAERKYGVVTQMGNQGHSGRNYHQFADYVAKGVIDPKQVVKMTAFMNNPRRWHKWNGNVTKFPDPETIPETLDWDTWLGTASFHDYSRHYVGGEWRSWYDFGNGCLGDWGAHTMDTMHRFFKLGLPNEVRISNVTGWNPFVFPMQDTLTFRFAATADHRELELDWYEGTKNLPPIPKGFRYPAPKNKSAVPPSGAGTGVAKNQKLSPGKYFEMADGTVWQGWSHGSPIFRCGEAAEPPAYERIGATNHYANFFEAVMGRDKTHSPFSVAAPLSEVFCLGCIAQRLNRSFKFDPAKKEVVGDNVANALLKGSEGTPRKGWESYYKV